MYPEEVSPAAPVSPPQPDEPFLKVAPGGILMAEDTTTQFLDRSGELVRGVQPSKWDQFWTDIHLQSLDAPTGWGEGSLDRMAEQRSLEQEGKYLQRPKIPKDEANRRTPGLPVPFESDVDPEVLDFVWQNHQKRKSLEAWKAAGPPMGWNLPLIGNTAEFAATAIALGSDPVNLMLGGATGAAVKLLGPLATRLGFAKVAETIAKTGTKQVLKSPAAIGVVYGENLVGNLLGEIPRIYQTPAEQRPPVTAGEVWGGSAAGSVFGTTIHLGLAPFLKDAGESVAHKNKGQIVADTQNVVQQLEAGAKVDIGPLVEVDLARQHGFRQVGDLNLPTSGLPHYVHQSITRAQDVHYYTAIDPDTIEPVFSDELGGFVGGDNPQVAHNIGAAPNADAHGNVLRFEVTQDARVVNGDLPVFELFSADTALADIPDKIKGILGDKYSQYEAIFRDVLEKKGTIQDLFNAIANIPLRKITPENKFPVKDFVQLIDGLGVDGIHFTGKVGDAPIDNRVWIHNREKLTPVDIVKADPVGVPDLTTEVREKLSADVHTPERQKSYDPELKAQGTEDAKLTDANIDPTKIEPLMEEELRLAEEQLKSEPPDSPVFKEYERINEEHQRELDLIDASDDLINCMKKGGG